MANDINRVILIGRLTRDIELKSTNNGGQFARISLASNRSIYNKSSGESEEEVGFFDCVAFGKQAETMAKYLQKGRRVCIEGHLKWSSWESDGKKQSKVEIAVDQFQFLDAKSGEAGASQNQSSAGAANFDSGAMLHDECPF